MGMIRSTTDRSGIDPATTGHRNAMKPPTPFGILPTRLKIAHRTPRLIVGVAPTRRQLDELLCAGTSIDDISDKTEIPVAMLAEILGAAE